MAGMTLSAVAAFAAADAIELELSRRPELELREMFSVLWRRIDHSRRGLSFEADLQRKGAIELHIVCNFEIPCDRRFVDMISADSI